MYGVFAQEVGNGAGVFAVFGVPGVVLFVAFFGAGVGVAVDVVDVGADGCESGGNTAVGEGLGCEGEVGEGEESAKALPEGAPALVGLPC